MREESVNSSIWLVVVAGAMKDQYTKWEVGRPASAADSAERRLRHNFEGRGDLSAGPLCQPYPNGTPQMVFQQEKSDAEVEEKFGRLMGEVLDTNANLDGLPVKSTRELGFFRAFLCSEFNSDCLNFVCQVNAYRQNPTASGRDAIISTFIRECAPQQINMCSELRQGLCGLANCGNTEADLFDSAAQHMLDIVCFDHYPRFLQSEFHNSFRKGSWDQSNQWQLLRTSCLKLRAFLKSRNPKMISRVARRFGNVVVPSREMEDLREISSQAVKFS